MATTMLSSPLRPTLITSDAASFICRSCRRTAATYRRTRKLLRVPINPAFAPSTGATADHIIFNPPSSAPNVYHTPATFLPRTDPRRALLVRPDVVAAAQEVLSGAASPASAPTSALAAIAARQLAAEKVPLPAPLKPVVEQKYHLVPEQIDEIRRLRTENPRQWTHAALAEKFECSAFFIRLCCTTLAVNVKLGIKHAAKLEAIKNRWGRRKAEAREDRQIRKALWGRDA